MPQKLLIGLLYMLNIQMLFRAYHKFELRDHCSLEQLPQLLQCLFVLPCNILKACRHFQIYDYLEAIEWSNLILRGLPYP